MTKKTYSIREAAAMVDRSVQTLEKYEKEGLVVPDRDSRGWRQYTDQDIEQIKKVSQAKIELRNSGKGGPIDV